jgi:hypothetical protein
MRGLSPVGERQTVVAVGALEHSLVSCDRHHIARRALALLERRAHVDRHWRTAP